VTSPSEFPVAVAGGETTARVYAAQGPAVDAALILGHGAGAGQQSAFMVDFARALAALGLDVVTFNFLYTAERRRIPDRGPALEACYTAVMAAVLERIESARHHLFIGGKSMGGRIATQVAATAACAPITGLVVLGYPLHPPGRPDKRRDQHLDAIRKPMLIVQGSRDAFGMPAELTPILDTLSPRPLMYVVSGGDHSFKITRRNPSEQTAIHDDIQRTIVEWIDGVCHLQP
jgi:predicted alpha/beta-hydrolase family hydrolase